MLGSPASTSLFEWLSESGFQSSVFTTYSCYFPFYEEVILRRLVASGCTHNVLFVDATRCAEAFSTEDLRPRRAGRDYTLVPVASGGAFHPKLFLRFGKSKGSMLVGSHNVTLSGFGLNDEVTNAFRLEGASLRSHGAILRQALDFVSQFVPTSLPGVVEAFEGVKLGAPWIDGPLGVHQQDRQLLTSSSIGSDLWSKASPLIPRNVATAFICAPFFDPALAMVRRLQSEVEPKELVIGIDPLSTDIEPLAAKELEGVRWVNVSGAAAILNRREGLSSYPHAKILWFANENEELLITGSANPSVAAFFAPPALRNAEAVVADRTRGASEKLDLQALLNAPKVTNTEWHEVANRRASSTTNELEPRRRILMATPSATGFTAQHPLEAGLCLCGIGDLDALLGQATARGGPELDANEAVRDGSRYLETRTGSEQTFVVIHRSEDVARNLGSENRKALRQALGSLNEDPTQLEALLKLTEKVIFDSDEVIRTRALNEDAPTGVEAGSDVNPETLALEAVGRKSSAKRSRSLASGDIVVVLDALIRRLGEGISSKAPSPARSEEEEIDADEENGGAFSRDVPDHEVLAKTCRAKVRRLIKRMKGQLELARESDCARRGIVRLAAVLGVIRALRMIEQRPEWRRSHQELVDPTDAWDLFQTAVLSIAWGHEGLARRAIAEADGEIFEELSMAVGLLAWLGWDIGTDIASAQADNRPEGDESEPWYEVQLLALLGTWLVDDASATGILRESVLHTPRPRIDGEAWLIRHLGALDAFAQIELVPDEFGEQGRAVRPGDLLILGDHENPRIRVVLDVVDERTDGKVMVFDQDGPKGKRTFLRSRVTSCSWRRHPDAVAASA